MALLPCSTDMSQFVRVAVYYYVDSPTVSLTARFAPSELTALLAYERSLGNIPIAATFEDGKNGFMIIAATGYVAYVRQFGLAGFLAATGGAFPVGTMDHLGAVSCPVAPSDASTSPPTCPPGYVYVPELEQCAPDGFIIVPVIPPPGGPPPETVTPPPTGPPPLPPPLIIPPPVSQPDPEGDEITFTLCEQMAANTTALLAAIAELGGSIAPGGDGLGACCQLIANGIAGLAANVDEILKIIITVTTAGATPVDLTAIVTELQCICTSLTTLAGAPPLDLTPVTDALDAINSTLAGAPPFDQTNLASIAQSQKTIADQGDVDLAILKQLFGDKVIPEQFSGLLQGSKWSDVLAVIEAWKDKWDKMTWWQTASFIIRLAAAENHPGSPEYPIPSPDDPPLGGDTAADAIAAGVQTILEGAFAVVQKIAGPFLKGMLLAHENEITTLINVQPGQEVAAAASLLNEASVFGLGAHFAAIAGEHLFPTKQVGWPQLAATLALFSGYDELIKGILGTEVAAHLTTPHRYFINAGARSLQPTAQQAHQLWARRLLDNADRDQLEAWGGLSTTFLPALRAGAYRPVSARALATLTADTPFPTDEMRQILEDNSLSPDHVNFMLTLLEYQSTKTLRNSYIAELETAYKDGIVSDAELRDVLGGVGWSDTAVALVQSKVALQKRTVIAKEIEKLVTLEVAQGYMTTDVGLQTLEGVGVQDWYGNLIVNLAAERAAISAAKKEAAAEAKIELARQRNLTKTAVAEYQRGVIDTGALTAALLALGLDPTLVASIVAVQDATRTGRLRLVFGQLLSPEDAKILTERVAAIEQQFKRELLTLDQAKAQLAGLNVDTPEIDALVARWAAALAAVSKTAYLVNPLTGTRPPPAA